MHQKLRPETLPGATRLAENQDRLDLIITSSAANGTPIEVMPNDTHEQIMSAASAHAKMAEQLNAIDEQNGLQGRLSPVEWAARAVQIQRNGGHVVRIINEQDQATS
jgi:hypothetical protein